MTKSRDILKGKVKRLLRDQDDMGQLCDPAVQHCVSALEAFVHDLGRRITRHAETSKVATITPIELKRCILESEDLVFLHTKVQAIDESEAKYHKTTNRKRKAPAEKTTTKKPKKANGAAVSVSVVAVDSASIPHTQPSSKPTTTAVAAEASSTAIEEDDNYDSSDSE